YDVLFSTSYLRDALVYTPEYFEAKLPEIQKGIEEAIKNKRYGQAFFLSYVIDTITLHMKVVAKDTPAIQPLADKWMQAFPQTKGFEALLKLWEDPNCPSQQKIDGGVYLLRMLNHRNSSS